MPHTISRRTYLSLATALGATTVGGALAAAPESRQESDLRDLPIGWKLNRVLVTPRGPDDGGDFGPHTPGTRTSGLQEALDAAKEQVKDVYICGGSWTAGKNQPVVYVLHETLRVPWMQDFRLESGHAVIHHAARSGDAVVFDSQMSCAYRFGLIVSVSDGAVVLVVHARVHRVERHERDHLVRGDRKSTRLNSSHTDISRMPSSA